MGGRKWNRVNCTVEGRFQQRLSYRKLRGSQSPFGWSKFKPIALALKRIYGIYMGLLLLRHCSQSCVARSRFHRIRPSFMCSYCQKEMGVILALNPYQIVSATAHNYLGRCMKHIPMQVHKKPFHRWSRWSVSQFPTYVSLLKHGCQSHWHFMIDVHFSLSKWIDYLSW